MYDMYDESYIDVAKVKAEIKKLKIPKEYFKLDLDKLFSNDFSIYLSIRENAGKTTQALILGLVLHKLYETRTEYLRSDEQQIARSSVENLYATVVSLGYVEKIFKVYNDIEYKSQQKTFRLVHRNADGEIDNTGDIVCALHSNENWQKYKSSYNSPHGDYIVFDEFLDSNRPTYRQMTELMNNISTIGRVGSKQRRNNVHVIMLGNNTDEYSHWWDDFTIKDKIRNMISFGSSFETITELGTSVYCKLIDINENKTEEVKNKKIKFFGFNTPQMAQFNGTQVWAQTSYPQIPDVEMLDYNNKKYNKIYIHHRDQYIQLDLYKTAEQGYFVFLHWANKPKYKDVIILTIEPVEINEVYGWGSYNLSDVIYKYLKKLLLLKKEHRWYYLNNQIGAIVDDFSKNIE